MATITISDTTLDRYLKRLRAYLTQTRIDEVTQEWIARLTPANQFRELVLLEKQPYLNALKVANRSTIGGTRKLTIKRATHALYRAAEAGGLLEIVEADLPPRLRKQMIGRLLSLDDRAASVVMEWRAAAAYKQLGFSVQWTEQGIPGPEFLCRSGPVEIAVECKRISRRVKELLTDRVACTLQHALVSSFDARGLGGNISWDTPLRDEPPDTALLERLNSLLPKEASASWSVSDPELGLLSGEVFALPMTYRGTWKEWINSKQSSKKYDYRFAAASLPLKQSGPCGAVALCLRGPRRTQVEYSNWIFSEAMKGAHQIQSTGSRYGVLLIEVQGITDTTTFAEIKFFQGLNAEIFEKYPNVTAICWSGDPEDSQVAPNEILINRPYCAQRNPSLSQSERATAPLPYGHTSNC